MAETWIPAARLLSVLDQEPDLNTLLSESERRFVYGLRNGHQQFVSLTRADALLTRLNMTDWLHLPKEMGGLADIYVDGVDYGRPNNHLAFGTPRRIYPDEASRAEARRRSWRESKRRRRTAA